MSSAALASNAFNSNTTTTAAQSADQQQQQQQQAIYYSNAHQQPLNATPAQQQLLLGQLLEQLNSNQNANNANLPQATDSTPQPDANAYLQAFFNSQFTAPQQPTPQPPQLPSYAQLEQLILWKQFEQQLAQQLLNQQQQQQQTNPPYGLTNPLFQPQPPANNQYGANSNANNGALQQPATSSSNVNAPHVSIEDALAQAVQSNMLQQQQNALEQALQQQLTSANNGLPQLPPLQPADIQALLAMSPNLLNSFPQPATVLNSNQFNNLQAGGAPSLPSLPTPANVLQSSSVPIKQEGNASLDPSTTTTSSTTDGLTTRVKKSPGTGSKNERRGKFYDKMTEDEKAAFRAKMSATVTGLWQKPEYRARLVARYREAHNTASARQNHSRALKEIAQRPEHREAALARMAAYRAAPEFKESSKRGQQASAMIRSAKAQFRREAASKYFRDGICQLCTVAGRSGLKQLNNPEQQFHHLKGTVAHHAEYKLICDQAEDSVLDKKEQMHQRTLERKREARHQKQQAKRQQQGHTSATSSGHGTEPQSLASTETSTVNSHDQAQDDLSPASATQGMESQIPMPALVTTTHDMSNPIDAINDNTSQLPYSQSFNPAHYNFTMPTPQVPGGADFNQLLMQYTQ